MDTGTSAVKKDEGDKKILGTAYEPVDTDAIVEQIIEKVMCFAHNGDRPYSFLRCGEVNGSNKII